MVHTRLPHSHNWHSSICNRHGTKACIPAQKKYVPSVRGQEVTAWFTSAYVEIACQPSASQRGPKRWKSVGTALTAGFVTWYGAIAGGMDGPRSLHSQLAPKINAILSSNVPCVEPQTYKWTVWPPTGLVCGTRPATEHRRLSRSEGMSSWATQSGATHVVRQGSAHPSRTCKYTNK